ncbi:MAG TPA: condensation domain-containing protein, partial [Pyrinomonadaceae bacterium]|nr:condensation domain-containing protein [Pyrinomonadaceae bacterium]
MPEEVVEGFQLSTQQKRLWLAQSGGDGAAFVSQCALAAEGALDVRALRKAFASLVSDYEILRTSFHSLVGMDVPVQVIADDAEPPDFGALDLSGRSDEEVEREIERVADEERRRPFDFKRAPLLHCALIKLADERHLLVITQPAMCADAGS